MLNIFRLKSILVCVFFVSVNTYKIDAAQMMRGVNGGSNCAGCTIVVALTEQLAIVYNQTIEKSLQDICNFLPKDSIFQVACKQAIEEFGPAIIDG